MLIRRLSASHQHETSPDADGQAMAPFFQTGYYALSEGDCYDIY